jgi:uncharacterized protein with ParB-like and HNH nuclease domain/predicted transport protein
MQARETKLLEFLKKSPQFLIPIYQRTYSWGEKECNQLWEDILRAGRNDSVAAHFVGSIVYVEKGIFHISNQSPLLVIDGQQRLTTVTLLMEALARRLGDEEPIDGFSAKKLRNYYLINALEDGERKYKLVLSQTDKASLIAIIDQAPKPREFSIRVEDNFNFFRDKLVSSSVDIGAVCKGIAKLIVVDISLDRDHDNPQLIFESLNSTGRELSQADLIRNFILMGLEPELQTKLYEQYWRPMEVDFGQEAYSTHFDGFMRHYLTVKTGDIPNVNQVYEAFKLYARSSIVPSIEELVSDIRTFAKYYCSMALGAETNTELKSAFQDLRELKVDVAYPFFLELYNDYAHEILMGKDFLEAVRLVESYVFRRAVCAIPTNSMNKTFAQFTRALKKDRYVESIKAHFASLPSYRRFPDDTEFKREIQVRDLYNFRSRSYWLRKIENFERKERVSVDEYTIEHILPQNENLPPKWQAALGTEWKRIQKTYLHTLGNLTLTGYNSEYSDNTFLEKRDMKGGFKESPLRVNQGLGVLDRWDENAITERGNRMAEQALKVWIAPQLPKETLVAYREKATTAGYGINDHPYLQSGLPKELFEAFRKEVLALDPVVTEEFLKLYVAYKAETNFVDVVPQAKRLRLSLNMPFPEINDPRGLCKDISGVGRWGNGDVEVGLSSLDELPYVMGLIRQSFERQMGNNGDGD